MKRSAILLALLIIVSGCVQLGIGGTRLPRTLSLDGKPVTIEVPEAIQSWKCRDFVYEGSVAVEVGILPREYALGFVLYDGGESGVEAQYARRGIQHRWDWGWDGDRFSYAFVLKSDGIGLFYDFTGTDGVSESATEVFKCLPESYRAATNAS